MNHDIDSFKSGMLSSAIEKLAIFVKYNVSDIAARSRLVEYYCIKTEYEKAEKQLNIIESIEPKTSVRVAEIRQILRAAIARTNLWKYGKPPEIIVPLPDFAQSRLRAIVAYREGHFSEVENYLLLATQQRPDFKIFVNDEIVSDFRDLDDFMADILEVYTPQGKYLWIPFQDISEAIFSLPTRPIEIAFVTAELKLTNGISGSVYVPCIYNSLINLFEDKYLMGYETEWHQQQMVCQGIGLRCFLKGDEPVSIHQIKSIRSV